MSPELFPQPKNLLDVRKEIDLKSLGIGTQYVFGGEKETIVTWKDFPDKEVGETLKDRTFGFLGYGIQAPAQSQNLRDYFLNNLGDNKSRVLIGQREHYSKPEEKKKTNWEKALDDGWVKNETLFSDISEVVRRANFIVVLLSDAAQVSEWKTKIAPFLKKGDVVQFSHGFFPLHMDQNGDDIPSGVDFTLAAPKGPGGKLREHFKNKRAVNSTFAIGKDASGNALRLTLASARAIGSGILTPTTMEKEAVSDWVGESGSLIGAAHGAINANSKILMEDLHLSEEEAVLHTSEIMTQTISRIIGEKGADGLINDLPPEFKPAFASSFRAAFEATKPAFEKLYSDAKTGKIIKRVIEANSRPDYRSVLDSQLDDIKNSVIEKAATQVRNRREKEQTVPSSINNVYDAIMAGTIVGIMQRQYELLRAMGHSPSEAFNETVEEATQSLYPAIGKDGIHELYKVCSTTAQVNALDRNKGFEDALIPALKPVYKGGISRFDLPFIDYILDSEMWKAGKTVRTLRPENQKIA